MHRLKIILEVAAKGVRSGFKVASDAVKAFLGGLASMVSSGRRFLDSLAQSVFFLGNAFGMLKNFAQGLFDRFVGGARDVARLEVRMKHLTGSQEAGAAMMEEVERVSLAQGKSIEDVAEAYLLMAASARDAEGAFDPSSLEENARLLEFFSSLRPDLPLTLIQRGINQLLSGGGIASLEMIMDMPIKAMLEQAGILTEVADDVAGLAEEIGGAATFIQTGAADQATAAMKLTAGDIMGAVSAFMGIDPAAMVEDIAELSGIERFNETLNSIARTLGEPLFDAINEGAAELAQWLQDNPEMIEKFATALGKLGAAGIENIFGAITDLIANTDWDAFFSKAIEFVEKLTAGDIEGAFAIVGLGDLGVDIKNAAQSLSDVAEALGVVAGWILKISGTGEKDVARKVGLGEVAGAARGRGAEIEEKVAGLGLPQWVQDIAGTLGTIQAATGPGLAQNVAEIVAQKIAGQKVDVAISLDSDLLHAEVKQISDDGITGAFNDLGEQMGNR